MCKNSILVGNNILKEIQRVTVALYVALFLRVFFKNEVLTFKGITTYMYYLKQSIVNTIYQSFYSFEVYT
jgi:hypothetical protein